jgi:Fe2+ or Zn2+ uptake regulation protein
MREAQPIVAALDGAGYRVTEPRRAVARLIAGRAGHFSAADIVADARGHHLGIGRATVFRALDLFAELGVVERLDLPSGDHAYVTCEPAHHHHVICSKCGRTADVDDAGLQAVTSQIARRTGFRIDTHRLEMFGLCPDCAGADAPDIAAVAR